MVSRRHFLQTSLAAAAAASLPGCRSEPHAPRWETRAYRKPERSEVAVLRAESYAGDLLGTVSSGLEMFALEISDRRVVLKPNLVEFDPQGVINTHPALIAATIEAFLRLGAREVVVAEGPGHRRDNEYLLTESGLGAALRDTGTRYVDLNQDSVRPVRLLSSYTRLGALYLPETVLDADLLVSMPKLKTHHWAGVTLSMKNMFGAVPGAVYGWPKNILHWEGIGASILDINAALEMPRFNVVDGIVGMEGNGPIQGAPKRAGVLVFGADSAAVDATCARLMSIDPWRVAYLSEADAFLGNIASERIAQLAENVDALRQDFRVLESFETLKLTPRATAG
jgi:uncharacterized protein (DUF362 family)